jgi:hypothetical protein
MRTVRRPDESRLIEIRSVLLRAAALHTSRMAAPRTIPDTLIRDLLIAVLLTDGAERPSARSRLERAIGKELADRLLGGPPTSPEPPSG